MQRTINIALFFSFLFCYLEWGSGKSDFVFQMEYEVIAKSLQGTNVLHPLIILPFLGQLILLFTIFQKTPGKKLTFIGIGLLAILVLMFLLVGILALNFRIIVSTFPFIVTSVYCLIYYKRRRQLNVN